MILTDVLTASDLNPMYYKFIPIFIKTWKKLFPEINIHIILIANEIIAELQPYKDYIRLFPPIANIPTAFIAQNIRLFYPCFLENAKGGILITDMDMVPMGSSFYINSIKNISDDKFICYRPLSCVGPNQMVICYNIAHSITWKKIFSIHSINNIRNILINNFEKYIGNNTQKHGHHSEGWFTDQLYLYEKTQEWNNKTNNLVILNNKIHAIIGDGNVPHIKGSYYRLWKSFPREIKIIIKKNWMADFHMPRPYEKNKKVIDFIVNIL